MDTGDSSSQLHSVHSKYYEDSFLKFTSLFQDIAHVANNMRNQNTYMFELR